MKSLRDRIQALEQALQQHRSLVVRFPIVLAIFTLYIMEGVWSSAMVLLLPSHASFTQLYSLHPDKGYTSSYSNFQSWRKQLRWSSLVTFVGAVTVAVVVSAIYGGGPPVLAAWQ